MVFSGSSYKAILFLLLSFCPFAIQGMFQGTKTVVSSATRHLIMRNASNVVGNVQQMRLASPYWQSNNFNQSTFHPNVNR